MSSVDNRIVQMQFDNRQFESNANTSMKTLDKLKNALNFDKASKSLGELEDAGQKFSFSNLYSNVETISEKFSAFGIIGVTALQNITNSAINTGKQLVSSLSIDQVTAGWDKYADKTSAVQTIMGATAKYFTDTGEQMEYVNAQLDKLNWFTDETSYNFLDMVNNIGKFTSNNIQLDDAVTAMEGISVWAASAGANVNEAGRAMYNLSQAVAVGAVKLIDWKSIENANMATAEFKENVIATAVEMGTLKKAGDGVYETMKGNEVSVANFNENLSDAWFTADVLMKTLDKYGGFTNVLYEAYELTGLTATEMLSMIDDYKKGALDLNELARDTGATQEELADIFDRLSDSGMALGEKSFRAAQEAKTFKEAIDATKDAVSTGWMNTFEIIFGNYLEAKQLWTDLANALYDVFAAGAEARNELLGEWKDIGGRDALIESFWNAWHAVGSIIGPIKEGFRDVFPEKTAEELLKMTEALRDFTGSLILSEDAQQAVKSVATGLFSVLKLGVTIFGTAARAALYLAQGLTPIGAVVMNVVGKFGQLLSVLKQVADGIEVTFDPVEGIGPRIQQVFGGIAGIFLAVINPLLRFSYQLGEAFNWLGKTVENTFGKISFQNLALALDGGLLAALILNLNKFVDGLKGVLDGIGESAGSVGDILNGVKDSLVAWQTSLKASALLKISIALLMLAGALSTLSKIEPESLTSSLGAMAGIFMELVASMAVLTKVSNGIGFLSITKISIGLLGVATAVVILTAAIKNLSDLDWDQVSLGLTTVGALLLEIVIASKLFGKSAGNLNVSAIGIIGLATAIYILTNAMKNIAYLNPEMIMKGLASIGAILAEIAAFNLITSETSGLNLIATAAAMNLIAASMLIFGQAVGNLGAMGIQKLERGLLAMGVALAEVAGSAQLMPRDMIVKSLGLVAAAGALEILVDALYKFGNMNGEQISISLLMLAASLGMIVAVMFAMEKALPASAALLIAAAAITALAIPLKIFGNMSLEQIGAALLVLAGTFTILGIAGGLLGPMVPVLIGLAGSIALLGVGIFAISAGVAAFAVALTALAAAGVGAGAGLAAAFAAILSIVPMIGRQLGLAVVEFARAIANGASAIVSSVLYLIDSALTQLNLHLPHFVDMGFQMLLSLLKGVHDHIYEVTDLVLEIVVAFLAALEANLPELLDEGASFIITFIDTLAITVEDYSEDLMLAAIHLGTALVKGMLKGIFAGLGELKNGVKQLGASAINAMKDALGIHSPSREFAEIGEYSREGFVEGLAKDDGSLDKSVTTLSDAVLETLKEVLPQYAETGKFVILGFAKGITDGTPDAVEAATSAASQIKDSLYGDSAYSAGTEYVTSFATGVTDSTDISDAAIEQLLQSALTSADTAVDGNTALAFQGVGSTVVENIGTGMEIAQPETTSKAQSVLEALTSPFTTDLDLTGLSSGTSLMEGFAEGITEGEPVANVAADGVFNKLGQTMIKGAIGISEAVKATFSSTDATITPSLDTATVEAEAADLTTIFDDAKETVTETGDAVAEIKDDSKVAVDALKSLNMEVVNTTNNIIKFVQEFESKLNQVIVTIQNFTEASEETLKELNKDVPKFVEAGDKLIAGLIKGFRNKLAEVSSTASMIAGLATSEIYGYWDAFYRAGSYLVDGMAAGIRGNSAASDAAADMAYEAAEAARAAAEINSPSRLFMRLGRYIPQGFAAGIEHDTGDAEEAVKSMVYSMMDQAKMMVQEISDRIADDVEAQPTITPVLNLEELKQQAQGISTIFAQKQAIAVSRSFGKEEESEDGGTEGSKGKVTNVNFVQNNYSPKALSRIEIYRQTKNQINTVKEVVGTT